ncbi:Tfp pilus assembly protein PilF [Brevirhabdus pacifica]|nr:tetratricopeptide repeat protein [Brevirhabdus pacifica]PJJ86511.1 Tfp pilus assembly protein PilF [Brevirhabdus pacifica]
MIPVLRKRPRTTAAIALLLTLGWTAPGASQSVDGDAVTAPAPDASGAVTLDLDQSRALARGALRQGNAGLAHRLASALLRADPADAEARLILAASAAQLGEPALAYAEALRVHGQTDNRALRYEAAHVAAEAAFLQGRESLAQIWLRAAAQDADDDARMRQTAQDYRAVRARNPWRTQLSFSLAPTSNINNGASTDRLIVNGENTQATLSGDAQALSGMESRAVAQLGYRLAGDAGQMTEFGLRLENRSYLLSDSAKARAPGARGADFRYGSVELSVNRHLRRPGSTGPLSFGATVGQSFYGGRDLGQYLQLRAGRGATLAPGVNGALTLLVERQWRAVGDGGDTDTLALGGQLQRHFAAGFTGGLRLGLMHVAGEMRNARQNTLSLGVNIVPDRPWGPVQPGLTLGASLRDFPDYVLGLASVPDGRQDTRLSAELELLFPKLDAWGFAPTLTLTAARGSSNISRFDTRQLGVSLGFRSLF